MFKLIDKGKKIFLHSKLCLTGPVIKVRVVISLRFGDAAQETGQKQIIATHMYVNMITLHNVII